MTREEVWKQEAEEKLKANAEKIYDYFVGIGFYSKNALDLCLLPIECDKLIDFYEVFDGSQKQFVEASKKMVENINYKINIQML